MRRVASASDHITASSVRRDSTAEDGLFDLGTGGSSFTCPATHESASSSAPAVCHLCNHPRR